MSILRRDLLASFVVFLVAVPLSLGIAVASGAPVAAGLIAAVAGGVVAGLLGGSARQVSGPAAGLTVLVAELVQTYGWRATCTITMLGGLVQLLLGAGRVARAALAVSPPSCTGCSPGSASSSSWGRCTCCSAAARSSPPSPTCGNCPAS